jgi:hypothetical protein
VVAELHDANEGGRPVTQWDVTGQEEKLERFNEIALNRIEEYIKAHSKLGVKNRPRWEDRYEGRRGPQ